MTKIFKCPCLIILFFLIILAATCARVAVKPRLTFGPSEAKWVEKTLRKMTLDEKIGQMIACRYSGHFVNQDSDYLEGLQSLIVKRKIGGLILVAAIRGCLSAANPFHMYFTYNHMFAAEVAWGYAGGKGEILKDDYAKKMSEEMVLQMQALFNSHLTYPKEFRHPLHRHVMEKFQNKDDGKRQ